MNLFFIILGLVSIVFTSVKFIRHDHWVFRFFDFPQIQFFILNAISFAGIVIFSSTFTWWELVLLASLLLSMTYEAYIIYPYTPLSAKETPDSRKDKPDLSIMICNVLQSNDRYEQVVKEVRKADPDVLLTVETDKKWEKALAGLKGDYLNMVSCPQNNRYGMHLFSKLSLSDTQLKYRVEDDIPSIETYIKMRNGLRVRLFCVHPKPPSPTESDESTERDGELLLIAKELKEYDEPVMIAGDLNDVAWSYSTRIFQRISGLLDPRIGRGFFNTYNANYLLMRWPLDHIFHSKHFGLLNINRLGYIGSDHFPMYAEFTYEESIDNGIDPDKPDEEDRKEARETIDDL